jgi:prepilin peptidase CpaA
MSATAYIFSLALVVTAVGAYIDWRTGHIPNWLTGGAFVAGLLGHAIYGIAVHGTPKRALMGAGFSVLGAFFCALVPLLLYRQEAIGGGDVKLLAALGAILQPMRGVEAELYGFVAVALIMPAKLAYEGKLGQVLKNTLAIAKNPFMPKDKRLEVPTEMMTSVRFGPGIFVGTCGAAAMHWSAM